VNASFELRAAVALSDVEQSGAPGDPNWTGIIEVLLSDLGGSARWESDSVVIRLPDGPHDDRVADLDSLRLCLCRMGRHVVFDAATATSSDPAVLELVRKLVECGVMEDGESQAA
jgi:hypothetical protein